jgi:hypothetical protein
MARIISLGYKVADIHQRYSTIHSALFGVSSYRMAIRALIGKSPIRHDSLAQQLLALRAELAELTQQVTDCASNEPMKQGSDLLPAALSEYMRALDDVMQRLINLCGHLQQGAENQEQNGAYRASSFNQEKIGYDHALSQLEHIGLKLNKLFASY